jgi:hypothetical protein
LFSTPFVIILHHQEIQVPCDAHGLNPMFDFFTH